MDFYKRALDRVEAQAIRRATLKSSGGRGPSEGDALDWRQYLTVFGSRSESLCRTVAKIAIRLATEEQDPTTLQAYNACRLIPLEECPGVRLICVGEVLRQIIGRTMVSCIQTDLKQLGGNQQLCKGQCCGIENAIHSLRANFDENEAVLLMDATNVFNFFNRKLALENTKIICPALFNAVKNIIFIPIAALLQRNNTMVRRRYHAR